MHLFPILPASLLALHPALAQNVGEKSGHDSKHTATSLATLPWTTTDPQS